MTTATFLLTSSFLYMLQRMATMLNRAHLTRVSGVALAALLAAGAANADTLTQVTSSAAQAANDTLGWAQKGADQTVLPISFSATTALANSVTVSLGAANSIISTVCTATPCSWTGTGLTAGHALLWTSDAANGGSGPVTLQFTKSVAGAGALIQADLPGAFTGQIQVYNGTTLLATYTVASDAAGDPVYLGALDQTGPNINKVVFSLTTCASLCTDFGVDTVNVNASTSSPAVTLTPTSLAFAATNVGVTTAAQVVTVKNSGTAPLTLTSETITGTNATSFIKSATTCTTTLAAGAACTVSVEFKPAAPGALSAALSIADNATGSPQAVTLTGTGVAPAVSLTPASIPFPATMLGQTTNATAVTLKNTGTATLAISSIAVAGTNPTSFVEIGTCGTSLAAGASCSLFAGFKPAAAGALSGTIAITDNAAGSPQAVTLTGTGVALTPLKLSATTLAFPVTTHGKTSLTQTLTITNSSTAIVKINSITLAGTAPADFVQLNTCGPTLAAAATCNVYVAFKPAAVATYSATLSISDTGSAAAQTVALTGTGN